MTNEQGTFAFPLHVKTRNNMVHFGNRNTEDHVNTNIQNILQKFEFFRWHASYNPSVISHMVSLDAVCQ